MSKTSTRPARLFFAIQHTYGANCGDERGNHIGEVSAWASKVERDEYVAAGNPYSTQSGARDALSTKGVRADRDAIRRFGRDAGYYGWEVSSLDRGSDR